MYGEMLRAGGITDDGRRQSYYDFIFFESERLSRLITNVLQLARLTNQDMPVALQTYSLCQLLDLVRSKVSTLAEAAGFTLEFVEPDLPCQGEPGMVLAEADAFVQICIARWITPSILCQGGAATLTSDCAWLQAGRRTPYSLCVTMGQAWLMTRCNGFSSSFIAARTTDPPPAAPHRPGACQGIGGADACQSESQNRAPGVAASCSPGATGRHAPRSAEAAKVYPHTRRCGACTGLTPH
jgi:hypothetical protein